MHNTQKLQIDWIRRQYYNNSSFIDILAKNFVGSGFLVQSVLYSSSLTLSSLFFISPVFSVIGGIFLIFFLILRNHHNCIESKLDALLNDMKLTELELHDFNQKNLLLADTITLGAQSNLKVAQTLEETRIELNEVQIKFNQTMQEANDSCKQLIDSTDNVKKLRQNLSDSVTVATTKLQELVAEVDARAKCIQDIDPKLEIFFQSEKRIDAVMTEIQSAQNRCLERFGQRFLDFKRKIRDERNQENSFFSASRTDEEVKPMLSSENTLVV